MLFRHTALSIGLLLIAQTTLCLADGETVLKNPSSIAPFQVCLTNDGLKQSDSNHWIAQPLFNATDGYVTQTQLMGDPATSQPGIVSSPFCFNQNLTMSEFQTFTSFERDLFVASAVWMSYFKPGGNPVKMTVQIDNNEPRFGGDFKSSKTEHKTIDGKTYTVEIPGALTALKGNNENVAVQFFLNETFGAQTYCFDPDPMSDENCKAAGDYDIVSVMLHEMGHGLGIASLRNRNSPDDPNYGNFDNLTMSAFDAQTNTDNDSTDLAKPYQDYFADNKHYIVFTGAQTRAFLKSNQYTPPVPSDTYGAIITNIAPNIPLSSQNFSHLSTIPCDSDKIKPDLVNKDLMGLWCFWQEGYLNVSQLDLHMLADMGYADVLQPTALQTQANDEDRRKSLFNPLPSEALKHQKTRQLSLLSRVMAWAKHHRL